MRQSSADSAVRLGTRPQAWVLMSIFAALERQRRMFQIAPGRIVVMAVTVRALRSGRG
jgi:hypothetical protein